MNIKTTVNTANISQKVPFPKLMIQENNGLVVYFYAPKCGVCLSGGDTTKPGEYSLTWRMDVFEDVPIGTKVTWEVTA